MVLFNEEAESDLRRQVAPKLFATPRRQTFLIEKPKFPTIKPDKVPDFPNLIGPNSWLLFSLLELNTSQEWLQLPVKYWPLMTDYRKALEFVHCLEVTNDCAERGVKLISEFKDITKDEEQLQYSLQLIEAHRRLIPSVSKENLRKRLFVDIPEYLT